MAIVLKRFGLVALLCMALTSSVTAEAATLPRLYLSLEPPLGAPSAAINGVVAVPRSQRFHFYAVMEAPSLEERFADLRIAAINQTAGASAGAPPTNLTVRAFKVEQERATEVPVRIVSSGGGNDMNFYFVDVELDIVQLPADVRNDASKSGGEREQLLRGMTQSKLIPVDNPPGLYEIRAEYKPSTPGNWRGVLTAPAVRIRVE
jgi:hypothetical protein